MLENLQNRAYLGLNLASITLCLINVVALRQAWLLPGCYLWTGKPFWYINNCSGQLSFSSFHGR